MKKTAILLFSVFLLILSACNNQPSEKQEQYVVMLSLDGFRWDYQDKTKTPAFDLITEKGVKAASLQPCFPSKTFPNHYAIATGLYPENNGLVNNTYMHRKKNRVYKISDRDVVMDGSFYDGEPIWNTVEKNGLIAGSYFWVGSEANINDHHITYWKKYDQKQSFESRIDSVIKWLNYPEVERPRLVTLYYHEPDGVGHNYGPDSDEMIQTIEDLDEMVGVLYHKLMNLEIADQINLILVSDHGMGSISNDRIINLKNVLKETWVVHALGGNPVYFIEPEEHCIDSIYNALQAVEHLKAWKRDDIPERFHLKNHPNVSDVIVVADSSWSLSWGRDMFKYPGGTHGYDNNNKDMHGIFYAVGPSFNEGVKIPVFTNVEIYNIIAKVLKIEPAPNDGDLKNVEGLFRD